MSEAPRWVHVDVDRPKYGVRVFVAFTFTTDPDESVETAFLREDGQWSRSASVYASGVYSTKPTWWMAMPEHPEAENMRARNLKRAEEYERHQYERLKAKYEAGQ